MPEGGSAAAVWGAGGGGDASLATSVVNSIVGSGSDVVVEDDVDAIAGTYGGAAVRAQTSRYARFSYRPADAQAGPALSSGGGDAYDGGPLHGGVAAGGASGSIFAALQVPVPPIDAVRPQHADGRHSVFDVDPAKVGG